MSEQCVSGISPCPVHIIRQNKQHALTWGQGQSDSAGHRIAEGTLHPAGQDVQQQAGDPAQALAACEALAPRAGNRGVNEDVFLCLP